MDRRSLLLLVPAAAGGGGSRPPAIAPDDVDKLNDFATHYNRYVEAWNGLH